ncbi:hypothetical protein EMIT0111MI5_20209 [Burkholderia sp. IT-111MI5]
MADRGCWSNARGAAEPGAVVGDRPARRRAACEGQAMRERRVPVAVHRRQQERQPPLVLDVVVRQSREGVSPLPQGRLTSPFWHAPASAPNPNLFISPTTSATASSC